MSKNTIELFFNESEALAAAGNLDEAGRILADFISKEKFLRARAHNDYGVIAWRKGKKEEALNHYRLAVGLDPTEVVYRKNLADLLYFAKGEAENALVHYRQILVENPKDFDAILAMGRICADLGGHFTREATAFFDLAKQINPENNNLKEEIKKLSDRQSPSFSPDTDNDTERVLEVFTGDPSETYKRIAADFVAGNNSDTEKKISAFITSCPGFALAHNDLGVISHQLEKLDQAEANYREAVRLAPQNITFRKNLADFLFVVRQQPEEAMQHYHEVLKSAPKDLEALMMIGNICLALNAPEEARSFFNLVLDIEPWNQDASRSLEMLDKHEATGA
ncbi:MAG TPA: tetratricopeptide repeat protein [Proteobacteria bacterium]|nr:tetratricopeptide repeat protein [Pseudomonadota bacterium]